MKKRDFFEILTMVLAVITVTITILDLSEKINLNANTTLTIIDNIITLYFITEYSIRLYLAKDRKFFIKNNKLDLLASLPFNQLFKVFRILKMTKVLRLIKLTRFIRMVVFINKINYKLGKFLKTNNFIYVLYICFGLITLGAFGIYIVEKGTTVNTFADSLWWSFVTATTVGYGDVSPTTNIGRIIAAVLMITGIGTIGTLTGTIATYFIKLEDEKIEETDESYILIDTVKDLSVSEKEELKNYIKYLKSKRK